MPLPLAQPLHGVLQGDMLQPVVVGVLDVSHLVHNAHGIPAVGVHRLGQAHRVHNGVHGEHHVLTGDAQLLGQLLHRRLPLALRHQPFTGLHDPVSGVPHTAADADGAVVPQIPPDLPHDHRHPVCAEPHRLADVEIVYGLNEPHTAHLKQIIRVFPPACKLLDHGQYQTQIAADQFLTCLLIPLLCPAQQLHGFFVSQYLQF